MKLSYELEQIFLTVHNENNTVIHYNIFIDAMNSFIINLIKWNPVNLLQATSSNTKLLFMISSISCLPAKIQT